MKPDEPFYIQIFGRSADHFDLLCFGLLSLRGDVGRRENASLSLSLKGYAAFFL